MEPVIRRARAARWLPERARAVSTERDHQFTWLLAAPRSGTTWLMQMLAAHSSVTAVNEPLIGAHLGITSEHILEVDPGPRPVSINESEGARAEYFFSRETRASWQPALGELLRARLAAGNEEHLRAGGQLVIKEPHGAEGAALLFEAMPDSRLLFLIRDPRDCLDSVLDIVESGWQDQPGEGSLGAVERRNLLVQSGRLWRHRIQCVHEAFAARPAGRRHLVSYEKLRTHTADELTAVVSFLGLESDPAWVERTVDATAFERIPQNRKGPGNFARSASPGGWRERLTPEEHEWAADFFTDELAAFGYQP